MFSSYKEMDSKTFLKIAAIRSQFLFENSQPEGFYSLKIQAFTVLSDIPYRKIVLINSYEWADLLPHVEFVFTSSPDLDKNPLPKLKIGFLNRKPLHGPVGLLSNLSIFEFCEADTAFMDAGNSQRLDKIYLLAAILYRPIRRDLKEFQASKEWNGDVREEYNQQKAFTRSTLFRKVPLYKLVAIFLYYWSCRQQELLNDPGLAILFKEKDIKIESLNIGWLGTMLSVANKEFGPLDKTQATNWKLVLYSIAKNMTEKENMDRAMEEQRLFNKLNKTR